MAKKKRRRGTQAAGVDPNERRRQRLEERRAAKAAAEAARLSAERRRRLVRVLIYGGLITLLVWFLFLRTSRPEEIAGHELILANETGVNDHVDGPVDDYETNPPVAGPHASQPAACGVHGEVIPKENLVHTLEHGAVGVLYQPDSVPAETIADIEEIVGEFEDRTFSAPYPDMDTPIAAVSWGEYMPLDGFDEEAIREYIDTFRGKGPENVPCPNTQQQPFEPEPTATAAPTPG